MIKIKIKTIFKLFYMYDDIKANDLEWITYCKVKTMTVLKPADVVVTTLARIVWHVETYTPVETENEELEVVTHTDSCAKSHLLGYVL